MRHVLAGENVALIACRQFAARKHFAVFCTDKLTEISSQPYAPFILFPLYLYRTPSEREGTLFTGTEIEREPNLSSGLIAALSEKLSLKFAPDGKGDLGATWGPEDAFHYAYSLFHSPTYRERYAEFLKIDSPRLPLTSDLTLFRALAKIGEELVNLHLMKSPRLADFITGYPVAGSNQVEPARYVAPSEGKPGRLCINGNQYFEGLPPDVWEFRIGGYEVLRTWLRYRRGRILSWDDLDHFQRVVVSLQETIRLMDQIDELIPSWPIE